MRINLTPIARMIRLASGVFLVAWAIAGGPIWAYSGVLILATGAWGFCPLVWLTTKDAE